MLIKGYRLPSRAAASLLLSFVLIASPLSAQPPFQGAPQKAPALRVTTRLVQVNVIVQDKKGAPVAGLTKDDFTLFDRGQQQELAFFSQERSSERAATTRSLAPNEFSNRLGDASQTSGSVTVILFDALNTKIEDQIFAREQVVKFLKQLQPQDHVAIYGLTTGLKIVHEFTQDINSLLRALEQYKGQSSAHLDASTPEPVSLEIAAGASPEAAASLQQLEDFLNAANQRIGDFYTINRARITTTALESIANHLARIPGRKNLVWVSGSFPIAIGLDADTLTDPSREVRTFSAELERAARAMNQADLAIYPVDARGLMTSPRFNVTARSTFDRRRAPRLGSGINTDNFATMRTLAERTGGQAYYNTNDISGSVRKALADSELTYSIGYYPNHGSWDGKFHEIKVHVNRPGVQVHCRRGYFATSDPPNGEAERKAALEAAMASPIDATSLGLHAEVNIMPPANSGKLEVTITLDLHELLFTETSGRWTGELDVVYLQRDSSSGTLDVDQKHLNLNFEQEKYDALLKTGISLTRHLPIKEGAATLKVVVRDAKSGAAGSVAIPLRKFLTAHSG